MNKNTGPTLLTLFTSILLLASSGCTNTSSIVTGKTRPAISPEEVTLYRVEPAVFEEVAIIEANSKGSLKFTEQGKIDAAMQRLKEQAAKLGANGIFLTEVGEGYGGSISLGVGTGSYSRNSGVSVGGGTSTASTYKIASGIAIHVISEN